MVDFTLLMAVYANDNESFVRTAYDSVTVEQTLAPTKVVIVRDGPVVPGVAQWLDETEQDPRVTVIRFDHNQGLATALNTGLAQIDTEIVARADADDISLPDRFASQLPLIEAGYDIVGAAIAEFTDDPGTLVATRPVPTTQTAIERDARLETPFHHPTVVFRRSAVLAAGGYPNLPRMEDYPLWAAMLMNGARVANIDRVLVRYRVGAGAFDRRGGRALAKAEADVQRRFLAMGFTTRCQYLRNRLLRGPLYRYMPTRLRRFLYHAWEARKARRPRPTDHD
ncbi:MAG: glycosyltransferase [Propionibacteriaceae bacterium]|jgi:glycosyltransferase involved in cell wall biosynthesis|nr:glycosyltransferase [Propionibacteriaceae bacterium]